MFNLDKRDLRIKLKSRFRIARAQLHLFWRPKEEVVIVTAADDSHFQSSINLLKSLQSFEPHLTVIYYDLGLALSESRYIQNYFPSVHLKKFPYGNFPEYFNVKLNAGEYAWKAACVKLAQLEFGKAVLWFDAGNVITGKLDSIRKIIHVNGIFIMEASANIGQFTHPQTLKKLESTGSLQLSQFSAAAIGFSGQNIEAQEILENWFIYSNDKSIIAPEGSSRLNHRQDQSILTLIILKNIIINRNIRKQILRNNDIGFYNVLIHQDVEKE